MKLNKIIVIFLALSFTSLFADITYEGARSVIGSYIEILGATAIIAGLIGIGELLGYLTRYISGLLSLKIKSSKTFWSLIILGYMINLFSVPLLAFANEWIFALSLIFLERIGKGLRTPLRDVLIAEVSESFGKGKGFGIHEFLDQVGAIAGPLIIAWILFSTNINYFIAFILLFIPALISLLFLFFAYFNMPIIKSVELATNTNNNQLPKKFWLYTIFVLFITLAFIHWGLVSFRLKYEGLLSDYMIALMYMIAMVADAIVAIPAGILYDKYGLKTFYLLPFLVSFSTIMLILSPDITLILIASFIWGSISAIYETNMRAAISDLVDMKSRGYAYGTFGLLIGISTMISGVMYGYLYENIKELIIPITFILSFISLIFLKRK
ncbi:MAG: MFS transporter [Thermoproteota archaeon]|nr:MFS transporter [Thermoproteota archaeon]